MNLVHNIEILFRIGLNREVISKKCSWSLLLVCLLCCWVYLLGLLLQELRTVIQV